MTAGESLLQAEIVKLVNTLIMALPALWTM